MRKHATKIPQISGAGWPRLIMIIIKIIILYFIQITHTDDFTWTSTRLVGLILCHSVCNQQHHPSYDNAACAGSDISTACHPPSLYEESLTSIQNPWLGKTKRPPQNQKGWFNQARPPFCWPRHHQCCPDGLWPTPVEGLKLFADCQRSNPSMALKSK